MLLAKLVDVLGAFAVLQVTAGARIALAFDSWVGRWGAGRLCAGMLRLTRWRDRAQHSGGGGAGDSLRYGRGGIFPRTACGGRRDA